MNTEACIVYLLTSAHGKAFSKANKHKILISLFLYFSFLLTQKSRLVNGSSYRTLSQRRHPRGSSSLRSYRDNRASSTAIHSTD